MSRMKRILKLTALILILTTFASDVSAEIGKISYDSINGSVNIQGDFFESSKQSAAVEILKPGKTLNDVDPFAYTGEFPLNQKGNFDIDIPLDGDSGEYLFRIGSGGNVFERRFIFVNKTDSQNYLNKINSAGSAGELKSVFENDYGRLKNIFGINILPSDKAFIYEALFNSKPKKGYDDFTEVKKAIAEIVLLNNYLKSTENYAEKLELLFDYFNDDSISVIDIWKSELSKEQKDLLSAEIKKEDISSISELSDVFVERVFVSAVNKCETIGKKLRIVKLADDLINIDNDAYFKSLSEAKQISILGNIPNNIVSINDFSNKLDNAIKKYKDEDSVSYFSGGGNASKWIFVNDIGVSENTLNTGNTSTTMQFKDLQSFPWAVDAISNLYSKNVINGKSSDIFAPSDNVVREEFTSMIVKSLHIEKGDEYSVAFSDVNEDDWFFQAVHTAASRKIVEGISDSIFGSGTNISRQDAILICSRAIKSCGISFDSDDKVFYSVDYETDWEDFKDASDIADYAKSAVDDLRKAGIIHGNEEKLFNPESSMSRAEAAVLISNVMKFVSEKTSADKKSDIIIDMLTAFGMYKGDGTDLDLELSRGEAAKLLCDLLSIPQSDIDVRFTDCKDNDNCACINAVCDRGLMYGKDNLFLPTEKLLFDDAVSIVMKTLGVVADKEQSFSEAGSKGILDGISRKDSLYITKYDFLKMFYNAADEKVMMNDQKYKDKDNQETFLNVYHNIIKVNNEKVVANEYSGIDGETDAGKNNIKIGSMVLSNENDDYNNLIGRYVNYYYTSADGGENELIYVIERKNNNVLTLSSKEIEEYSNFEYSYIKDGGSKTKKLSIHNNVNVIYNNQTVYDYDDEMLNPKSGYVTFVDADGNGNYTNEDTIIVTSYDNIVVGSINRAAKVIYDKYDKNHSVNLEKLDDYLIVDTHGDEFGINELREWDVLAVVQSPDKTYTKIVLVDEAYAGKINSIDLGSSEIEISGKNYELSEDYRGDVNDLTVGKDVTAYLDLFGDVCAVKDGISEHALNYSDANAYQSEQKIVILTRCGVENGTEKAYAKTYGSDEKFTFSNLADKLKLNGKTEKSQDVVNYINDYLGKAIIIKYNEKSEICEIITAAKPGVDKQRGFWEITYDGESLVYKSSGNGSFGNRFIPGDVVYTVPGNIEDYNNERMFGYNEAGFSNDTTYTDELIAYTTTWQGVQADAVVYKSSGNAKGSVSSDTVFVINKIVTKLNEDDEPADFIEGLEYDIRLDSVYPKTYEINGEADVVDIFGNKREDFNCSDLGVGDVVRLGLKNNKIHTVSVAYDCSSGEVTENNGAFSGYTYGGYAYGISDNKKCLTVASSKVDPSSIDISSYENGGQYLSTFDIRKESLITIVDLTEKNVTLKSGSADDILTYANAGTECSRIVVCCDWQSWVTAIIVYVK